MGKGKYSDSPEPFLVDLFKKGDMDAFDELFDRHRRGLLAYVRGIVKDRDLAEDIVQDCFVMLAKKIGTIKKGAKVSPWLYRVARNRTIDVVRRRKFELLGRDDCAAVRLREDESEGIRPDDSMISSERKLEADALLSGLPEKERQLLMLRFYGDLTFREISEVVKRPLGTVLWQVRRALEKVREAGGES